MFFQALASTSEVKATEDYKESEDRHENVYQ